MNTVNKSSKRPLGLIIGILTVVLLIGIGIFTFVNSGSSSQTSSSIDNTSQFRTYSPSELSYASGGNQAVIFFNASWCPTCRAAVKEIEANKSKIDPKLRILSADYDKEIELRRKYNVTTQHTFVEVDSTGKEINKVIGLATVESINNFVNQK